MTSRFGAGRGQHASQQRSQLIFAAFLRQGSCNHTHFSHVYFLLYLQKTCAGDISWCYLKDGSIKVKPVSGSRPFSIAAGLTVTITSSVGDTYASRKWPPLVVPSEAPTSMCVWT